MGGIKSGQVYIEGRGQPTVSKIPYVLSLKYTLEIVLLIDD